MGIKKSVVLGGLGGIASIIGGVVALVYSESIFSSNLAYFLFGFGFIVIFFPFVLNSIIKGRSEREKEEMFLEFTRNLVESVESGTPISKSIINMRNKNFGSLTPHVQKLANQIDLGIPLQQGLQTFAFDTKSETIIRAITLIREADKTGGNINKILESVAKSVSEIEKLKVERRAAISAVVVEGYIIFVIFIIIMIVMEVQIIPMTTEISGISSTTQGSALPVGGFAGLGNAGVEPAQFSLAFLALLVTQGFFAGIVIGKLAEGKLKAGIKHSFIMMAMAILISTGSKFILQ